MTTNQPNRETEFRTMLIAANADDVDAQYAIANKYWEGVGTRQAPHAPFQLADHFAGSEIERSPRSGLVAGTLPTNPVIKRA